MFWAWARPCGPMGLSIVSPCNPQWRTLYQTILEIVCKVLEDRTRQSLRLCAI
uniref:Uncharacterized protein n=1 Tax=Helianthus annuus TaxID=4232 RepID=A0A251T394_HELAN